MSIGKGLLFRSTYLVVCFGLRGIASEPTHDRDSADGSNSLGKRAFI